MGILDAPAYSQGQSDARFAANMTPANAGARKGRFDNVHGTYNWKGSNTTALRGVMGGALAGTRQTNILCIGDSKTAGLGTNGGGTYTPASSYPGRLSTLLGKRGYPIAGTGWVYPVHNMTTDDARFVYTGSWASRNASTSTLYATSTGAGTVTFTSDAAGTIAEFQYLPTSTGFTYQIDGGSAVGVTPAGSGVTPVTVSVTGLSNATHTIKINATATGVLIQAFQVRQSTGGILVSNAGVSGATATNWIQVGASPGAVGNAVTPAPDVALIQLGINDCRTNIPLATFNANLAGIVSRFHSSLGKATILLVSTPPIISDTSTAKWATYVNEIYNVAEQYDIPVIDLNYILTSYEVANPLGLYYDGIHENDAGYATDAAVISGLISV